MMNRFCRYIDKCFHFQELPPLFRGSRQKPHVPGAAVFASVFALFCCNRQSLNSLEKDLIRFPSRLRGLVGPQPPSIDTIGRVYALADSDGLRKALVQVHRRLKRNKASPTATTSSSPPWTAMSSSRAANAAASSAGSAP